MNTYTDTDVNSMYPHAWDNTEIIVARIKLYQDMTRWCLEQFGGAGERWKSGYQKEFEFTDPHDELLFKLRWA